MAAFSHLDRPKLSTTATGSYELFSNPAMKWGTSSIGTAPAAPITYSFSFGRDGTGLSNNNTATSQITSFIYRREVERAFETWESMSNLQFARAADGSDADIDLYFAEIDGSGSVLATAWNNFTNSGSPGTVETIISAEIEFDEFEMSFASAQRFYLVAIHEIGHVLGLEHVDDNTQIMYEFYNDTLDGPQDGDIAGIHELYGVPSSFTSRVSTGAATDDQIDRSGETIDLTVFAGSGDDSIRSGLGDDSLFGGIGDDIARAGAGRDMIFDAFGNDTVFGDDGDDSIYAPGGRNVLSGGTGNDALRGGIGNDLLNGGDGNDALMGDDQTASSLWFGDDTLIGGTGNDSMEGGRGQDVFVFAPNEGSDQIGRLAFNESTGFSLLSSTADFTPGQDKIDVNAFSFASADQVLSSLSSTSQGTRFSASNTEVLLIDVSIESLTIEDFLW